MYKQLFCDHDYKFEREHIIPSELDMYKEHKIRPTHKVSTVRVYTVIYKCANCKKLKDILDSESHEAY
jgi:hypothetical protein